jgi:hypothetical protein
VVVAPGFSHLGLMKGRALLDELNLTDYPLNNLATPEGAAFVSQCRQRLQRDGALALPGFAGAEVLPALVAEAEAGASRSRPFLHHFQFGSGTSDETYDVEGLPADDPRRYRSRTALTFVGEHLIPAGSWLRRLYAWPPMMDFLAQVLRLPRLHRRIDGLSGINYTVMSEGDEQSWHYDEAHFITSILLQPSEAGGDFEYVRGLRSDAGDDLDGLKLALAGCHPGLVRLELDPGTLLLFEGRYAFHRATPVVGTRCRCLALLAFDQRPGISIDDDLAEVFYGRRATEAASSRISPGDIA